NVLSQVFSMFASDDHEGGGAILRIVYPSVDLDEMTYRSVSVFGPYSRLTDACAIILPFLAYTFIIIMRRKVLNRLTSISSKMSQKTKLMHESMIKALTYHAILPCTTCIGVCSFGLQMMGVRHRIVDSALFVFSCIPAVVNPLLTLYFIAPYRR
ncbi:hypothetical protein PFISCL1PPCAC_13896, partial [Pristionchus fissidentatus]